jgi:NAD+ diphosphatase
MEAVRLAHPDQLSPTFTGMGLDRAQMLRKDAAWVHRQLEAPGSRAVLAGADRVLLDGSGERVARLPLAPQWRDHREAVLLGLEGESALFAVDLDLAGADDGMGAVSLRDAGARLPQPEGALAAYAVALLNWHRKHRFCANCGAPAEVIEAGYARRCPRCETVHFPRTDPVVIMLVESDGRLLLGHRTGWPEGRYSVLAGFISPGESAEEAVVREVQEESGIAARDPVFVASQPWPFPSSLMLGFEAQADGGEPVNHDGELDHVAWFSRDQVRAAAAGHGDGLLLPPSVSIARFLIDRWLAA